MYGCKENKKILTHTYIYNILGGVGLKVQMTNLHKVKAYIIK